MIGAANTGQAASAVVVVALKTESPEIPGIVSGWPQEAARSGKQKCFRKKKVSQESLKVGKQSLFNSYAAKFTYLLCLFVSPHKNKSSIKTGIVASVVH